MGLLGRLRRRSKSQSRAGNAISYQHHLRSDPHDNLVPPVPVVRQDVAKNLPPRVLARIFAFVCPHAADNSYASSEESMTEDGCMLCDMRDLAHCALVCKLWRLEAQALLYSHIRIDAVHYCELEVELAAKRKRRSFFDRNGDPIDPPKTRLEQFARSVRESQVLANMVLSLRMPYMTREANKAEIARTVSVCRNIRYVDLPAGIYSDDPSCLALKHELMARPEIRRMSYRRGSERSFSELPGSQLWVNLEVLELSQLQIDPSTLRSSLASFPTLRELTLDDIPWLDDSVFIPSQSLPQFPAVQRLTLRDIPNVTASGLTALFSIPSNRKSLRYLTLSSTGVHPSSLYQILSALPYLLGLLVTQEVSRPFPTEKIPPLASRALNLLHYEITLSSGSYGLSPAVASYYTYLISSLMSNSLPALRDLYVRDADFPETLMLAPPPRLYAGGENGPQFSSGGLSQPLNVYSKGLDELEWNFTPYEPPDMRGRGVTKTRPVSFQDAQLSRSWGGDARKSVLVGNGFGGFLAVPVEDERPRSSGGYKRQSRQDLWR